MFNIGEKMKIYIIMTITTQTLLKGWSNVILGRIISQVGANPFIYYCTNVSLIFCVCMYMEINWIIIRKFVKEGITISLGYGVNNHESLYYNMLYTSPNIFKVSVTNYIFLDVCEEFMDCLYTLYYRSSMVIQDII